MRKPLPWGIIIDLVWIVAITIASSLLTYSGWREQGPFDSPDLRAHQANAIELIRSGVIPYRGQGLSYSGWGPPGTSFLMVPGVLLMSDPRLAEIPGAVLLHFGTLLFLFLIVRGWIGRGAAWAAVVLAGFLPFTGPTLWPNGHPFFVVGMLYCLMRWVRDRSPGWFSAAWLLAGLGMYVYFTLAPALIAMVVIALVYHRPFSMRGIAATLGILFLVWLPYLNFEAGRGFVDIGSMLLRRDLGSAEAQSSTQASCYASLPGETDFQDWNYLPWIGLADPDRMIYPGIGKAAQIEYQLCSLYNKLDRNFDSGHFLFGEPAWPTAILFGLYAAGVTFLLFRFASGWKRIACGLGVLRAVPAWKFLLSCGIGSAIIFLLIQPAVVGTVLVGDPDWDLPARLLLTQIRSYGTVIWISLVIGLGLASRWDLPSRDAGVPALMIGVSGVLLWWMSEIERSWRFYWLWPLQCIVIVAAVEGLVRMWKGPRWVSSGGIILAMVLFFPFRSTAAKLGSVFRNGYAGRESGQIQAMEWLAAKVAQDPLKVFSIGVTRHQGESDPTRAWGWLEFGLIYLFDSPNAEPSDLLPENDLRVVEFLGEDRNHHPPECPWDGYESVWVSWRYAICERQP